VAPIGPPSGLGNCTVMAFLALILFYLPLLPQWTHGSMGLQSMPMFVARFIFSECHIVVCPLRKRSLTALMASHSLITTGQQLRTLRVVTEGDIERLGHWARDSSMVRRSDTSAGVSELSTRTALLRAVREGWRPVANCSLPSPLPMTPGAQSLARGCPQTPRPRAYLRVGHAKRKRKHHVSDMHRVTVCGMWTCGSRSDPAAHALFEDLPSAWDNCRNRECSVGMLLRHGVGVDARA